MIPSGLCSPSSLSVSRSIPVSIVSASPPSTATPTQHHGIYPESHATCAPLTRQQSSPHSRDRDASVPGWDSEAGVCLYVELLFGVTGYLSSCYAVPISMAHAVFFHWVLPMKEVKSGFLMLLVCVAFYVQLDPRIWNGLCQLLARCLAGWR
jgi:hypothetical protein